MSETTKCPLCGEEMDENIFDSLTWKCPTDDCPVSMLFLEAHDIDKLRAALATAQAVRVAELEAAQVYILGAYHALWTKHNDLLLPTQAEIKQAAALLAPQPPAPTTAPETRATQAERLLRALYDDMTRNCAPDKRTHVTHMHSWNNINRDLAAEIVAFCGERK